MRGGQDNGMHVTGKRRLFGGEEEEASKERGKPGEQYIHYAMPAMTWCGEYHSSETQPYNTFAV